MSESNYSISEKKYIHLLSLLYQGDQHSADRLSWWESSRQLWKDWKHTLLTGHTPAVPLCHTVCLTYLTSFQIQCHPIFRSTWNTIFWIDLQNYALIKHQYLLFGDKGAYGESQENGLFDSALGASPVFLSPEPRCIFWGVTHSISYQEKCLSGVFVEIMASKCLRQCLCGLAEHLGFRLIEADLRGWLCQSRGWFPLDASLFSFLLLIQGKTKGNLGQIVSLPWRRFGYKTQSSKKTRK